MPIADELCKSSSKRVLLVEGKNDCHVIMALCEHYAVPETFGIYECGSDTQLLKRLNALISQPDPPEMIGVVLDADTDVANRWMSLQGKLRHYNYNFPQSPSVNGTVVHSNEEATQLGIWLMPNNQEAGMLEDFCAQMIDAKAKSIAEYCVDYAQSEGVCTFKSVHKTKAIVHTYLAWQDEPGRRLGQAITCQALRAETETAASFIGWLNQLFNSDL